MCSVLTKFIIQEVSFLNEHIPRSLTLAQCSESPVSIISELWPPPAPRLARPLNPTAGGDCDTRTGANTGDFTTAATGTGAPCSVRQQHSHGAGTARSSGGAGGPIPGDNTPRQRRLTHRREVRKVCGSRFTQKMVALSSNTGSIVRAYTII